MPTLDNPADCASRGVNPDTFHAHPLWWSGPKWLIEEKPNWPKVAESHVSTEDMEENPTYNIGVIQREEQWELQFKYSSWSKLLRITAYCQRFVARLRSRHVSNGQGQCLTPQEIQHAKIFWLKKMQEDSFGEEIRLLKEGKPVHKSSSLTTLVPFIDSDGLLRVTGRLQHSQLPDSAKVPIVLTSHPLLTLMLSENHIKLLHGGNKQMLAYLQNEYWVLRARSIIRSIIHRCIPCTRQKAKVAE